MLRDSTPPADRNHQNTPAQDARGPQIDYLKVMSEVSNVAYNLEHHESNSGQPAGINAILDEVYGTALKGASPEYQRTFSELLDLKLITDGKKDLVVDQFASENFDFLSSGKQRITTRDLDGKSIELGLMNRPGSSLAHDVPKPISLNTHKFMSNLNRVPSDSHQNSGFSSFEALDLDVPDTAYPQSR